MMNRMQWLMVLEIHLNAVHAPRVLAASREDFLDVDFVHGGDGVRDALAHRGVARLPSEWNRRHVRRVGFEQNAIERYLFDRVANVLPVFKRRYAGEAEAQIWKRAQQFHRHPDARREAVHVHARVRG